MNKRIAALVMLAGLASSATADDYVNGYTRSDGTYVQGYYRSSPNSYRYDNYSSSGNTNPYTGSRGYERNEFTNQLEYNQGNGSDGYRSIYGD